MILCHAGCDLSRTGCYRHVEKMLGESMMGAPSIFCARGIGSYEDFSSPMIRVSRTSAGSL